MNFQDLLSGTDPTTAIAGAIFAVIAVAMIVRLLRPRKQQEWTQAASCPGCGWSGRTSVYAGRCPKCGNPIGEGRARRKP